MSITENGKVFVHSVMNKTVQTHEQKEIIPKKEKVINAEVVLDPKKQDDWFLIVITTKNIFLQHFVKKSFNNEVLVKNLTPFESMKSLGAVLFCSSASEVSIFYIISHPTLAMKPLNTISNFSAQKLMVHQNKLIAINGNKITVYNVAKNVNFIFIFFFF